ncbi:hypothetical protein CFter6_0146 [Collimonas fungivorans]|uniref:Uncharacterized protein n=1 Tax=Collimonas fungivorans TaxID=158899 RepID=A0A127P559_9BURK|nr:hypothetical protein [Collimonas fungivorans]AMO92877.1 hypothetical protein CFter6_0146 [Collimonas fungivorans]
MIRVAAFAIAAIAALPAWANCAVADALIDRYGISFSGFTQALPRVSAPAEAQDTSLLAIVLPNQNGRVADGYNHEAWINKEQKRAWILRTGGFAGVYEWYGPAVLPNADFSGCVTEPRRLPPPASTGRQG